MPLDPPRAAACFSSAPALLLLLNDWLQQAGLDPRPAVDRTAGMSASAMRTHQSITQV